MFLQGHSKTNSMIWCVCSQDLRQRIDLGCQWIVLEYERGQAPHRGSLVLLNSVLALDDWWPRKSGSDTQSTFVVATIEKRCRLHQIPRSFPCSRCSRDIGWVLSWEFETRSVLKSDSSRITSGLTESGRLTIDFKKTTASPTSVQPIVIHRCTDGSIALHHVQIVYDRPIVRQPFLATILGRASKRVDRQFDLQM